MTVAAPQPQQQQQQREVQRKAPPPGAMPVPPEGPKPARARTSQLLGALHRLTLEACRCKNRKSLEFHMLNKTVELAPYDRAVLFLGSARRFRLVGASGRVEINRNAKLASLLKRAVNALESPEKHAVLPGEALDGAIWDEVAAPHEVLLAFWCPILSEQGKQLGGLWLERWSDRAWQGQELALVQTLAEGYAVAWERYSPGWFRVRGLFKYALAAAILAAVVYALVTIQVPLRVVAPCEVTPYKPHVVAAPLDGAVEELLVQPGQEVTRGQPLFEYDSTVAEQELEVAEKAVMEIQAELERAQAGAFHDPELAAEALILKHRMRQEQLKRDMAREVLDRQVIHAPADGVVMLEDPDGWKGRPVRTGERMAMVLRGPTKLRIWLPQDDNVELSPERDVDIFLHVSPETSFTARIAYISPGASSSPEGVPSFVVEALWSGEQPNAKVGLQGMAVMRGEQVRLGYWIFRKPWTSIRRWLGV